MSNVDYEAFKNGDAVDIAWELSQKHHTSFRMELNRVCEQWLRDHDML